MQATDFDNLQDLPCLGDLASGSSMRLTLEVERTIGVGLKLERRDEKSLTPAAGRREFGDRPVLPWLPEGPRP